MSPTQALFWKEWRQIQWRWTFYWIMSGMFVYVGLKTRVQQDEVIILFSFLMAAFLLPLFVAMGLVAEEREQNCLTMQLALPVETWRIYTVKIIAGALAVITPTIICLAIALIMAGNREKSLSEIIRIYLFAVPFSVIYMLWIVVLSMRRKTQWATALTGLAILAVWVFLIICDDTFLHSINRSRWNISLIITPFGFLEAGSDGGKWLATSVVQGIVSILLFWWGQRQFSSLIRSGK